MPFLPPNQQRQSTEDKLFLLSKYNSNSYELKQQCSIRCDALLWLKTGLNLKLKITQQQKTREKFPVINITSAGGSPFPEADLDPNIIHAAVLCSNPQTTN